MAIPLKKLGIFNPPGQKTVFSLPPRTQNRIFVPSSDMFFSCDPRTVLSNSTPLTVFCSFTPPRTAFFSIGEFILTILPPDIFFDNFTPSDTFSRDHPRTKICGFLPTRTKTRIYLDPIVLDRAI